MRELALEQHAKLLRVALRVIDAGKHHPLVAHPPSGPRAVCLRRVDEVAHRVLAIDGHQDVAQLVARRVQRDGERHRDLLLGQLLDARDQTARRHDDPARADAEQLWICEPPHGIDHRTIVRHRLAHAHEHDV